MRGVMQVQRDEVPTGASERDSVTVQVSRDKKPPRAPIFTRTRRHKYPHVPGREASQ